MAYFFARKSSIEFPKTTYEWLNLRGPYTFKILIKTLNVCRLFWRQKTFWINILTDQLQLIFFDEPSKFLWQPWKFWFVFGLVSNFWTNNFLFLVEIEGNSTKIKMSVKKENEKLFLIELIEVYRTLPAL